MIKIKKTQIKSGQSKLHINSLAKEKYGYNTFGELTSKESAYNSSAVYDIDYTRDALGRVATKTETDGTSTHTYEYVYDVSGRLEEVKKDSVTISTYVYDDNNNRTGGSVNGTPVTATYDNQDRLLTYNDLTFTYNHNGERTGKTDTTTSQTTSYDYNALGQLEKITLPSSDEIEYAYDGLGRRVARSYNGTPSDMYVYENDLRIVADLNPSTGEVKSRYVYVSQLHSPDFMIRDGEEYQFVKDHLGSVKLVVKVSDGSIVQNITYDEFGKILTDSNPGFQPFGFAGGIYDHQASLTKFGVRDYDGEVGRWLTKDPILFNGGEPNLYGYVLMDPVNFIDPEGTTGTQIYRIIKTINRGNGILEFVEIIKYCEIKERIKRIKNECGWEEIKEEFTDLQDCYKEEKRWREAIKGREHLVT